ncbi:MAG TPA: hypothetical protein VMD30_07060 [Tepidisphaeraceae bacterium]|nr:hypothetical protein [Tepidisphaeraceae bacterium]
MSAVSLPVTRPTGRGLLIGRPGSRQGCVAAIARLGFTLEERDDPYAAMAEIARHASKYSAVFMMLGGMFNQELSIISAIKSRFGHVEIWLAQTDGRQAAVGEAVELGADGILTEDGLHRLAAAQRQAEEGGGNQQSVVSGGTQAGESAAPGGGFSEPILTAEELQALLQEPPVVGIQTGTEE